MYLYFGMRFLLLKRVMISLFVNNSYFGLLIGPAAFFVGVPRRPFVGLLVAGARAASGLAGMLRRILRLMRKRRKAG